MPHRDLVVKGGQCAGKGGGGVAVDQDHVRLQLLHRRVHAGQALGGDGTEGLAGGHDVQVPVRREGEDLQHAVQHLPVLGGDAAEGGNIRQLPDQRGHFNGLRPGAEYAHNAQFFHVKAPFLFPSGARPDPNPCPVPSLPELWDGRGDSGQYGPL